MKRKLIYWLAIGIVLFSVSVITIKIVNRERGEENEELYEEEENEEKEALFIEERSRYEFEMLKDPATGKIPVGIFEKEIVYAKTLPSKESINNPAARIGSITSLNNYLPAGPNNIGGRTRALAYDLRFNGTTNQVIIAGSVSSGIMRSSNGGTTWVKVSPEEDTHSFTVIAQDPRAGFQDIWYAAGGEPYGNTTSEIGATYLEI